MGWGGEGIDCKWARGIFFGVMEMLQNWTVVMAAQLYKFTLKTSKLYTYNGWILQYGNYTSIKLLKKKNPI